MDSIVLTWRELLIAAIVILGVYIAEVLLLLRHGRSPALRLWREARKASEPSFAIGPLKQEIAELKLQIAELRAQMEAQRAQTPTEQPTPYAQAIQMARGGGAAPDISSSCGISRGEAELITALYRKR